MSTARMSDISDEKYGLQARNIRWSNMTAGMSGSRAAGKVDVDDGDDDGTDSYMLIMLTLARS